MQKQGRGVEQQVRDAFNLISKRDGWIVFIAANEGMEGTEITAKKLNLTKKQYYTRLKALVDVGLVHKVNNTYLHTSIGAIIFKKNLLETVDLFKNIKRFQMRDELTKTGKYTKQEIDSFFTIRD